MSAAQLQPWHLGDSGCHYRRKNNHQFCSMQDLRFSRQWHTRSTWRHIAEDGILQFRSTLYRLKGWMQPVQPKKNMEDVLHLHDKRKTIHWFENSASHHRTALDYAAPSAIQPRSGSANLPSFQSSKKCHSQQKVSGWWQNYYQNENMVQTEPRELLITENAGPCAQVAQSHRKIMFLNNLCIYSSNFTSFNNSLLRKKVGKPFLSGPHTSNA
jgi:hypothetical protein